MKIITDEKSRNRYLDSEIYKKYFGEKLRNCTLLVEWEMGDDVLKQGENPVYLCLMVEGRCSVRVLLVNGKSMILQTLKAPCLIGEMELIRQVSSFTVQALERCRMLAIPLDKYKDFLMNDIRFLQAVCVDLIGKERSESLKLLHAFGYPLEKRLAHFILENRQGNRFYVKKVHIAESLGVSYRHVETVMSDFVKKGYLSKEGLVYKITGEEMLQALGGELEEDIYLR